MTQTLLDRDKYENFIVIDDHYNDAYLPLITDLALLNLLWGGRNSGKSYAVCKTILLILINEPGTQCLALRKELKSAKKTVIPLILKCIRQLGIKGVHFKVSETKFYFNNHRDENGNPSTILVEGCDDPNNFKGMDDLNILWFEEFDGFYKEDYTTIFNTFMRGQSSLPTLLKGHDNNYVAKAKKYLREKGYILEEHVSKKNRLFDETLFDAICDFQKSRGLDETGIIDQEVWAELLSENDYRLNKQRKNVFMTSNPSMDFEWVYDYFIETDNKFIKKNLLEIHTTIEDNMFADEQEKESLRSLKNSDPYAYMVDYLGMPGSLEEVVLKEGIHWKVMTPEQCEKFPALAFKKRKAGIDWGTVDPNVYVEVGKAGDDIFLLNEVYEDMEATTATFFKMIKRDRLFDNAWIYADASRKDLIRQGVLSGFNIQKARKTDLETNFIDWSKTHVLYVHPSCENAIRELRKWRHAKKPKTGKILEETVDENNHVIDALRYACYEWVKEYLISDLRK